MGATLNPAALALRPLLSRLTDALEKRDGFAERIFVDVEARAVFVDSSLDDVDQRQSPTGFRVMPPDGLWEWAVRRDFVRALASGSTKTRLGTTLGGPKTRRRFEVALAAAGGDFHAAFRKTRRRRLRRYAGQVLRAALYAASSAPGA